MENIVLITRGEAWWCVGCVALFFLLGAGGFGLVVGLAPILARWVFCGGLP